MVQVGKGGTPEAHRACLDADGRFDDVVAYDGGRLRFWRDATSADPFSDDRAAGRDALLDAVEAAQLDGLADFLRRREDDHRDDVVRQHYDVTIADLAAGAAGVASLLHGVPRDRQPVLEESSAFGEHQPDVIVADLDGDGISDVLLVHPLTLVEDGPSLRSVQAIVLGTTPPDGN